MAWGAWSAWGVGFAEEGGGDAAAELVVAGDELGIVGFERRGSGGVRVRRVGV